MSAPRRRVPIWCAALLVLGVAAPPAPAQYATAVAVRGQAAPDSGGNPFTGFEAPALNNFGQVAFLGVMPGANSGLGVRVSGVFLTRRPPGTPPTAPQLTGSVLQG